LSPISSVSSFSTSCDVSHIQNIVNNLVQDTFKSVEVEEMVLGSFEDTLYVPEESCDTSHDVENDETYHTKITKNYRQSGCIVHKYLNII
jgi:homoserine acetyltransferase